MLVLGAFLIIAGFVSTHVSGAMPGTKPLYPMPLRIRVVLISSGLLMFVLG
jgi:hypothetical protein